MEALKWGTREWFESMFDTSKEEDLRDFWGVRWRGYHKFRYSLYISAIKRLPSVGKGRILDIGCALGDFTKHIAELNGQSNLYAIDLIEKAVVCASKHLPKVKLAVGALPYLPFQDNNFDVVTCLEVLYYLSPEDRMKALEEIKIVLKKGGYLFLSVALDDGSRYFSSEDITELIGDFFQIRDVRYNYGRLYVRLEAKILRMRERLVFLRNILLMSPNVFMMWYSSRRYDSNILKLVKSIHSFLSKRVVCQKVMIDLLYFMEKLLRGMLSQEKVVFLFHYLTKLFVGAKGAQQALIIATKP